MRGANGAYRRRAAFPAEVGRRARAREVGAVETPSRGYIRWRAGERC